MSSASSPRAGKRKRGSESNVVDCESVQIDQLKQQVAQKDKKIFQLKTAIDSVLQLLWIVADTVESPQTTLPSPFTVPGTAPKKNDSPKNSTPDTKYETARTSIPGDPGKTVRKQILPELTTREYENSKNKPDEEDGCNDRPENKRRRKGDLGLGDRS